MKIEYLGLDLETDSLDKENGRICEIALLPYDSNFERIPDAKEINTLVNPGLQMSDEVIAIHNITNEMVAEAQPFSAIAADVQALLDTGAILVGQGLGRFDIPFLHNELVRNGQPGLPPATPFIDTLIVEQRAVPRNLSALHERYCGGPIEGAHRADADVDATLRVLAGQVQTHDLPLNPDELFVFANPFGDRTPLTHDGTIYADSEGNARFGFGKHRDALLSAQHSYCQWMLNANFPSQTKATIRNITGLQ